MVSLRQKKLSIKYNEIIVKPIIFFSQSVEIHRIKQGYAARTLVNVKKEESTRSVVT